MKIRAQVLVVAIVLVVSPGWALAQDSVDKAAFFDVYRKALEKWASLHRLLTVEGELVDSTDRKNPEGVKQTREVVNTFSYVINQESEKLHLSNEDRGHFERVYVVTEKEKFVLRRDDPKGELFLEQKVMTDQFERTMRQSKSSTVEAPFSVARRDVREIINAPGLSAEISRVDGADGTYKVQFTLSPEDVTLSKLTGWFTVNTSRLWTVGDYDVTEERRNKVSRSIHHLGHLTYQDDSRTIRPLIIETSTTERGFTQKQTLKPSKWSYGTEVQKGFDLASYGLASPVKPPASPAPGMTRANWLGWAMAGGLVSLTVLIRWVIGRLAGEKPGSDSAG